MTTTTIQEKLAEVLVNNVDVLRQIVGELNSWDGSFENLAVYENDEDFFETFFEGKTVEAVRATQFGEYNYSDDYVRFNGYGNLDSLNEYQLNEELKDQVDEIVDALIENRENISLDQDIEAIIDGEDEEDGE